MPRGAFIVIEGLDRSGKSTQAGLLQSTIQENGHTVELLKFPDRTTPIGKMIDAYLRSESDLDDQAVHLLFSANRWEATSKINALLASGTIIICDRYAFSGVAFSVAKSLSLPSPPQTGPLSYDWCKMPDTGLPRPDLTLFFDVSPSVARQRGAYGEERYEKEEMQSRVRSVFESIFRESSQGVVVVDANKTKEEVQTQVWDLVRPLLETESEALGKLWMNN
ncbi:thymidylate kinase [Flagelloscypha sp. PMI_526]|nr:thymidylate kinase [Flagelloscypha sp. PMI_526]